MSNVTCLRLWFLAAAGTGSVISKSFGSVLLSQESVAFHSSPLKYIWVTSCSYFAVTGNGCGLDASGRVTPDRRPGGRS